MPEPFERLMAMWALYHPGETTERLRRWHSAAAASWRLLKVLCYISWFILMVFPLVPCKKFKPINPCTLNAFNASISRVRRRLENKFWGNSLQILKFWLLPALWSQTLTSPEHQMSRMPDTTRCQTLVLLLDKSLLKSKLHRLSIFHSMLSTYMHPGGIENRSTWNRLN